MDRNLGALAALALAVVLAGCIDAPGAPSDPPVPHPPAPDPPDPGALAPTAQEPLARVVLDPVAEGFARPVFATHAGDGSGRLFVVEREGAVRVVRDGAVDPEPYLNVSDRVACCDGEQGLHGLAFHPDFAENGRLFITYSRADNASVLEEWTVADASGGRPGEAREVLVIPQNLQFHYAGWIGFGPDGFLYYARGDGLSSGASLPGSGAQNRNTLLGKVLRLDVDAAEGYAIPPTNPYAQGGGRPEVWALGLRNPWRASFDRATGDLWLGDVGFDAWEEVDLLPRGAGGLNFGWRAFEAEAPQRENASREGLTFPVHAYAHAQGGGCSVTGGHVVHGPSAPGVAGWYVFADFCTGRIWALRPPAAGALDAPPRVVELRDTYLQLVSFGEDETGDVYVLDYRGDLFRLTTASP